MSAPPLSFERLHRSHISPVIGKLWQRGQDEALVFGFDSAGPALRHYVEQRVDDEHAYAALAGVEPIAIFGAYPVSPDTVRTWFLATDGFNQYGLPITRKLRKLLESEAAIRRVKTVETFSACVHEQSERWFRSLGLLPDTDYNSSGGGIRRFVRRFTLQ